MKWLKLARVHHYIKNILIFFPMFFNGSIFDFELLKVSFLGFIAFGFTSSIIYIINDLHDLEKDKKHPTKCKRPLASGQIKKNQAVYMILGLISVTLFIHIYYVELIPSVSWLILYFVLNLLYSLKLKNIPIIDIAILVSGFLIRVLYGAAITSVVLSNWLILTVMSVSFYLALGKRRNEYQDYGEETREVLKYYNYEFLDKNMTVSLALSDIFYSLWSVNMIDKGKYSSFLIWTIPLILLIQMKYSLNIEGNSDGDPVEVLFRDKVLISMVIVFFLFMFAVLYG